MGVHCATELYFWRTRHTRLLDLVVDDDGEVEDSRELRGRIRIATMMPSSVPLLLLLLLLETSMGGEAEDVSLVAIVLYFGNVVD